MTMHSNLWFEQSPPSSSLHTGIPREADVVIVGGGLAGLITLHTLVTNTSLNVFLFEEGQVGAHASGRNVGSLDIFYFKMLSNLEDKEIADYLKVIVQNNADLYSLIINSRLDCECVKYGGLYLSSNSTNGDLLSQSYVSLTKHYNQFLFPKLLSKNDIADLINSTIFNNGIFVPNEFMLNPMKLVNALVDDCEKKHGHVITNAVVESVTQTVTGLNVHIRNRGVVTAKNVIYCGGSYSGKLIPSLGKQLNFYKKHVIATAPIVGSFLNNFPYINLDLDGIKMRRYQNRILVQGLPVLVTDKYYDGDINLRSSDTLKRILRGTWPILGGVDVSHVWSYMTCAPKDGKPLAGEIPNRPNEFLNVGHNINNIMVTSDLIKNMILKNPNPDSLVSMFNPGRKV